MNFFNTAFSGGFQSLLANDLQLSVTCAVIVCCLCVLTIGWFAIGELEPKPALRSTAPMMRVSAEAIIASAAKPAQRAAAPKKPSVLETDARSPASMRTGIDQWACVAAVVEDAMNHLEAAERIQDRLEVSLDAADLEFDRLLEECAMFSRAAASRVPNALPSLSTTRPSAISSTAATRFQPSRRAA